MPKLNEHRILNVGIGSFLLIMREALLECFKLIT
jgi:hypothetical protein